MTSRFIVTLFVALTALLSTAPAALGHAELESTDPVDGGSISTPYTVSGTFTEPLVGNSGVIIRNGAGEEVARSSVSESDDPTVIEVELPELPAGDYVARWTATTEDGHTERFSTEFTVVAAATPEPSPTPTEAPATSAPPTDEPSSVPTTAPATTTPTSAPTVAPTATPEPAEPTSPSSSNDLLIALLIAGVAIGGVLGYLFLRNRR
jgi:methionine-rich copper-binding protein CopC